MAEFNIDTPQANQILIWSEVDEAFINVDPNEDVLNIDIPDYTVNNLSSNGESIVEGFTGDTLRVNRLVAGNGVTLSKSTGEITIEFDSDSDAQTLNGFTDSEFLKVSNNLSEVDVQPLLDRLDVYTKDESHDEFMETNASNIPDMDNVYDMGSNGRRFADIYAKTFHGTATRALVADTVASKGAVEGEILIWRSDDNDWMPEDVLSQYIKKEGLQILPPYGERIHEPSSPIFDVEDANIFTYECADDEADTIQLVAPEDGYAYSATIEIKNGDNADIIWPSNVTWVGMNSAPSFTAHDMFTTYTYDGMNWFGLYVGSITE